MDLRMPAAAAAAVSALILAGCSAAADAAGGSASDSAAGAGDTGRYCELVEELDALGEQIFADVPQDASPEEYMRREQMLVEQGAPQLEELEEVAPEEIREDVGVLLDDLRERAATGQSPDAEAAQSAEGRIRAFEEENCPGGPDGS